MSEYSIFTPESVSEGHPDKMADQIPAAVLAAINAHDPHARVALDSSGNDRIALVSRAEATQPPE